MVKIRSDFTLVAYHPVGWRPRPPKSSIRHGETQTKVEKNLRKSEVKTTPLKAPPPPRNGMGTPKHDGKDRTPPQIHAGSKTKIPVATATTTDGDGDLSHGR